jgi:hypothetical protein
MTTPTHAWVRHLLDWAYEDVDELDFHQTVVPKRVQEIIRLARPVEAAKQDMINAQIKSEVEFRDPPVSKCYGGGKALVFATELKKHPFRWAVFGDFKTQGAAYGTQSRVRKGEGAWGPRHSFEARCAKTERGTTEVFVRYVGIK